MNKAQKNLLQQQTTIMSESPKIIAKRIDMFSQPIWTWSVFLEYQHMYLEKMTAMNELWHQWAIFFFSPENTRMMFQIPTPQTYYRWLDDTTDAANRALHPITTRVRANQRRLSKLK